MAIVPTVPYCIAADLVVGNVPLPASADVNVYIKNAAEEIDAKLGSVYVTPIIPDEAIANSRVAVLTLKNINAHLASGRILTALTAGGEDNEVHAYGLMLIRGALDALRQLATGDPALYGAPKLTNYSESKRRGGIYNIDEFSQVESFTQLAMPGGLLPQPVYPTYIPYGGG